MDISREILQFLHYHPLSSRDDIAKGTAFEGSDATLKRLIAAGVQHGDIVVEGKARATRYRLSDQAHLLMPLTLIHTLQLMWISDRCRHPSTLS